MILRPVTREEIPVVWSAVQPFFEKLAKAQPLDWPEAKVRREVLDGLLDLWLIGGDGCLKAVGATTIFEWPNGERALSLRWVVGSAPRQWVHLISEVERYARDAGCRRVLINFGKHKAWTRLLPDYTARVQVELSKEL